MRSRLGLLTLMLVVLIPALVACFFVLLLTSDVNQHCADGQVFVKVTDDDYNSDRWWCVPTSQLVTPIKEE